LLFHFDFERDACTKNDCPVAAAKLKEDIVPSTTNVEHREFGAERLSFDAASIPQQKITC
jgi:hypothetical protein